MQNNLAELYGIVSVIDEYLSCQEKLQELNRRRRNMRAKLEENEEAILEKRQSLIKAIRNKMKQETNLEVGRCGRFSV